MALAMASSSCFRTSWFCSYAAFFSAKVASISALSFSSAAFAFFVSPSSPFAFAEAAAFSPLSTAFSSRSELSFVMVSLKCSSTKENSWAWLDSSSSTSASSCLNFLKSPSKRARTPPDCDSYASTAGAPSCCDAAPCSRKAARTRGMPATVLAMVWSSISAWGRS